MSRKSLLIAIVGKNKCGKTYFLQNNIINVSKKALIVVVDEIEYPGLEIIKHDKNFQKNIYNLNGCKRVIFDDNLDEILTNCHDCSLILDDCKSFLDGQTPRFMRKLYTRRRARQIDIYLVCHSFIDIPPAVFKYIDMFVYFKTNEYLPEKPERGINPFIYDMIRNAKAELDKSNNKHEFRIINIID
jgi:hypothetical protein